MISQQKRPSFVSMKNLSGHFKGEEPNYSTRIEIFETFNFICVSAKVIIIIFCFLTYRSPNVHQSQEIMKKLIKYNIIIFYIKYKIFLKIGGHLEIDIYIYVCVYVCLSISNFH